MAKKHTPLDPARIGRVAEALYAELELRTPWADVVTDPRMDKFVATLRDRAVKILHAADEEA